MTLWQAHMKVEVFPFTVCYASQVFAFMLVLILLAFWICPIYSQFDAELRCAKPFYGSPGSYDCTLVLQKLASLYDDRPRYFDEEQLRGGPSHDFPGVKNDQVTQVVQLPGYWSLSR